MFGLPKYRYISISTRKYSKKWWMTELKHNTLDPLKDLIIFGLCKVFGGHDWVEWDNDSYICKYCDRLNKTNKY